jgi:oligopeptide transport system substrate-binding protein
MKTGLSIRRLALVLLASLLISCSPLASSNTPTPVPSPSPTPPVSTAELSLATSVPSNGGGGGESGGGGGESGGGGSESGGSGSTEETAVTPADMQRYDNEQHSLTLFYPRGWLTEAGQSSDTLAWFFPNNQSMFSTLFVSAGAAGQSLEEVGLEIQEGSAAGMTDVQVVRNEQISTDSGVAAWLSEYEGTYEQQGTLRVLLVTVMRGQQAFTLMSYSNPREIERQRETIERISRSIMLNESMIYGVPRSQALVLSGGESQNPRAYDPATGSADTLIFSGLVSFGPQLELVADLAAGWDISADGTVYTFYLRQDARFHNGRPVTAEDVVYSWERAVNPATRSDTIMTYLNDIVGAKEMHAGQAAHISGLKIIDDHTLQVTIDAPKPYFLMKLTYGNTFIVDRENVESGSDWYRKPNGTGPYKLIRWDSMKVQIYERNEDFYLEPPAIPYVVVQMYEGIGMRMYETGQIDMTGVSIYDLDRLRNPSDPLNSQLHEAPDMCTSYIMFDVNQAPFDDPKVRQAFALAVDREQYIDVVMRGSSIPAHGILPPSMPGHNSNLRALDFNPELARQRLAESSYGSAQNLPPIVFTSSGFGSSLSGSVAALADMWSNTLGITIEVELIESNYWIDEINAGNHGQLLSTGWCADYPDPENFLDVLFHSESQQNNGNYRNSEVDRLLSQARTETDTDTRIALYQQAEQLVVDDAAAIFLSHSMSYLLTKPYLKGYVPTPINIPIERYLSFDQSLR